MQIELLTGKSRRRQAETPDAGSHLSIRGLTVKFGGVTALDSIDFDVEHGTICGLIGPNGAGKTTCFNCISGVYLPAAGEIRLGGENLIGRPRHRIAERGIGRTFQNLALFQTLSVRDNVMVGGHLASTGDFGASIFRLPSRARSEERLRHSVEKLLKRFRLNDVADENVQALPFPVQKRVELARAMAGNPALLILDEPAAGLNHAEVDVLAGQIEDIRAQGVTVLLVEHHMNLVMRVSDKIVVLNFGKKIADGVPADVRNDPAVISAYLGSST